jgi:hypothetical protein
MEPLPSWLHDAVAAAGIAGVYTDFDAEASKPIDEGTPQPPTTH